MRAQGDRLAEEKRCRWPVSGSTRLSLTRGAVTSTGPALVSLVIGKASLDTDKLVENYDVGLDELLGAKPSAAKGRYTKKITVSTTGPGMPVDPNRTSNLLADDAAV